MKKVLPILSIAVVMAACNANVKENAATVAAPTYTPDTAGLAQFQDWKTQHELADAQQYNNTVQYAAAAAPVAKAKPAYKAPVRKASKPVAKAPTPVYSGNSGSSVGNNESGSAVSTESNEAKAPVKEGWSKAAKGTAIGTGAGAAIGAVVTKKNRVLGGVIGGVVGGAVGYGIGRGIDKKDGRY